MKDGDTYTVKGQSEEGIVEQIRIFANDFERGWKIKEFTIVPRNPGSDVEVTARLITKELPHSGGLWDWSSNYEVAWAAWNVPASTAGVVYSEYDDKAIVIDDLYIDINGPANELVNWSITLEKLSLKDWEGALAMVRTV